MTNEQKKICIYFKNHKLELNLDENNIISVIKAFKMRMQLTISYEDKTIMINMDKVDYLTY